MIPKSAKEFDLAVKKIFGLKDLHSLVSVPNKVRMELGGSYDGDERVSVAMRRSMHILDTIFSGKNVWMRLVSWESNVDSKIVTLFNSSIIYEEKTRDSTIYYIYYDEYEGGIAEKVTNAIIEYDLALDNGLNIRCLFINLDIPAIVNIYDDRGMDVLVLDAKLETLIKDQYKELVL